MSNSGFPNPLSISRAAAAVLPALQTAAQRTGADFGALVQMARVESGFRPDAKAATSSATGLFQFVDSTWLQVLKKHGANNGIPKLSRGEALALRNDPHIASVMAAEHMQDNAAILEEELGRKADGVDLYFAHFLGVAGATRFLGAMAQAPDAYGAGLFPAAAKANRAIFYSGNAPRSLSEIHQLIATKLDGSGVMPASPFPARPSPVPQQTASLPDEQMAAKVAPRDAARLAYLLLAEMGG